MREYIAKDVDDYLGSVSADARTSLEKLRKTIKSAAPDAEEVIRYRMPMFKHQGLLVGFASFTKHCSFFVMSPEVMDAHKEELSRYETSKGTIRFATGKSLPVGLVTKLVKARIVENEMIVKARQEKKRRAKSGKVSVK